MQLYYFTGILFLAIFWLISWGITGNPNPFAMAKGGGKNGENENYNASLVQMIVFTMLTVFAYTTVFAARALGEGGSLIPTANEWLKVPSNLLILMGISVGTAVASRAIRVQQAATESSSADANGSGADDRSSLTTDSKGKTDLVKIQMLIWTVIAVVVYLTILSRFMVNGCYLLKPTGACAPDWGSSLPDIDSAFMVLLGVSQGGYVINKLSKDSPKDNDSKSNQGTEQIDKPKSITNISIKPTSANLTVDAPTQPLTVRATDAQNNAISDLPDGNFK